MLRVQACFDVVFEACSAGVVVARAGVALPSSRGMRVGASTGVGSCGGFSVVRADVLDGRAQKGTRDFSEETDEERVGV